MTDSKVPEKYQPETRDWERKEWLYEQYWGDDFASTRDIAERTEASRKQLKENMDKHGIPKRDPHATADNNTVSAFVGFYNEGELVPPDHREYDPEARWIEANEGKELTWEKAAKKIDRVGSAAQQPIENRREEMTATHNNDNTYTSFSDYTNRD